jgi:acetoin:2,6-dichlorophenolindophenol oxidoreductase subunit beta
MTLSTHRTASYETAIVTAIAEEMRRDERVFTMATFLPAELTAEFGETRVRRTPISEAAITGMAIGAAGSGLRPIVGWGSVSFSFVAFDQVINQAARIRYMFGGQRDFPIVFRARYLNGTRSAAQHSQTGYALFAHAAGLKLAVASNPADAKGLLKAAIRDDNPVVFFEAQRLGALTGEVGDEDDVVAFGSAAIPRAGTDVTIVAIGYMVVVALEAAEQLAREGISAEVVDPRTLVPLDVDAIRGSLARTGRLVVVDESFPTCSMASEIAALVAEDAESLSALKAPVRRVCTAPVPVPFSAPLEDHVLPGVQRVCDEVRALVA